MGSEASRLSWLIREQRLSQTVFAQEVGATVQTLSNVLAGRRRISRDLAERVADRFGVSLDWLLRGSGPPRPDMETTTTTQLSAPVFPVVRPPARCSGCGQEIRPGDQVCPRCHGRLEWPE